MFLPALDSPRIQDLRLSEMPNCYSAYDRILRAEQHAVHQQAEEDTMCARVAGYLLLEFHTQSDIIGDRPCTSLVNWVISSSGPRSTGNSEHSVVFDVGKLCRDKFIRLFRTCDASYPQPSLCPSFDTLEDMNRDSMELACKDYSTSRKKALARDGYRCMITGMFDRTSLQNCSDLEDMARRDRVNAVAVQTCHILNESTMQGIGPTGPSEDSKVVDKTHHSSVSMAILEQFGFSNLVKEFKRSGDIHQVWNLLSLEPNLQSQFDNLNLWFENIHQGRHNCYKVCVFYEADEDYIRRNFMRPKPHIDGAPMVVEFTSEFAEAPPPDPRLLALHAMCARVAHMSGAAEFFDRLQRDAEEVEVLASDGSSAPLLGNLISPFSDIPGIA